MIPCKAIYSFSAISYQITQGIFHRTGTKIFKICIETQKTPNDQSNPEKVKQSWRVDVDYVTKLQ